MTQYPHNVQSCGRNVPGLALDDPRQTDHPQRDTTIGQTNIEAVLMQKDLSDCRLLHVGIGNSQLAARFRQRVEHIDGITLGVNEQLWAQALNLDNYQVYLLNKYSDDLRALPGGYDVIVDNNIFSYACCQQHFLAMMGNYQTLLNSSGEILTERRGLHWIYRKPDVSGMNYADLTGLGKAIGMSVGCYSDEVYFLRKQPGITQ